MKACPERSAALALLRKYNAEPFHIQHGLTVEGVMRWYAQELSLIHISEPTRRS